MAKKKKKIEGMDLIKDLENLECEISADLDKDLPFFISTGSFSLDMILSEQGGFSIGCAEMWGAEGTGKSSLALSCMSQALKQGMTCFYIDMERALTKSLVSCFLDPSEAKWIKPSHGQAAFNGMERILRTTPNSFIVLDSIPACISSAQLEEDMDKASYAPIPTLLSRFMPKARKFCNENNSFILFLNQLRANMSGYGKSYTVPGGYSIKFNTDWRMELKRTKKFENSGKIIGHQIKVTTEKNRFYPPWQEANLYLVYGRGFHQGFEVLDIAIQLSIIKKGGAWFELPNGNKVQGFERTAEYLLENKEVFDNVVSKIKEMS